MFKFLYNPLFGLMSEFFITHINGMTASCMGVQDNKIVNQVGLVMIVTVLLGYALLYHFIDSTRYHKKGCVWLMGLVLALLNALIAFFWVFGDIRSGNFCSLNPITMTDAIGFAMTNAIWALLLFLIISSLPFPRAMSKNLSHTTFWKP